MNPQDDHCDHFLFIRCSRGDFVINITFFSLIVYILALSFKKFHFPLKKTIPNMLSITSFNLLLFIVLLANLLHYQQVHGFKSWSDARRTMIQPTRIYEAVMFEDQEVTSKEIERLRKKRDELVASIATVKEQRAEEEKLLEQLEAEFGGEISRIKKEFARMKERAIEESVEISNTAKSDALKEVLPITDNYYRAKTVFEPITSDGDKAVMAAYDHIFEEFMKVIEGFGVKKVASLGQPFDFNFMEAIMTQVMISHPGLLIHTSLTCLIVVLEDTFFHTFCVT